MNDEQLIQAEKHIRNAWIAGAVSAAFTFVFSLWGAYSDDFRYKYGLDTWSLLDVALIAALSYGIYKKNRWCALGLLVYFVISKFAMAATTGGFAGGFMSLLFAYFYFQGTKAAFQLHKQAVAREEEGIGNKKKSVWYYVTLSVVGIIVLGLGALMILGAMGPEIEVIPGKQVNKKYLSFVREQGLVDDSDQIHFWYSDGFPDFKEGFYLFTNEKVVVYSQIWEEPALIVPYSEIIDIDFEPDPSFIEDSRIYLTLTDST